MSCTPREELSLRLGPEDPPIDWGSPFGRNLYIFCSQKILFSLWQLEDRPIRWVTVPTTTSSKSPAQILLWSNTWWRLHSEWNNIVFCPADSWSSGILSLRKERNPDDVCTIYLLEGWEFSEGFVVVAVGFQLEWWVGDFMVEVELVFQLAWKVDYFDFGVELADFLVFVHILL